MNDEGGTVDFTVNYQPTPDEVARALGHGVNRQFRALRVALPAVLVAAGLLCLLVDNVSLGVGMFAGAAVFPLAWSWAIRWTGRRQLAYICVPTTLHMTSDGYETRTDQSTTKVRWSLFGRIDSTPEFWLFFVDRQCAAFLPKRAFNDDQRQALETLFAAHQNRTPARPY